MNILVIADIHANLDAFKAVLADARQRAAIDDTWCLGDIVGYGPDPGECIRLVREAASICVAGNHDLAAIGSVSQDEFNPAAREAILWTAHRLTWEDVEYLGKVPCVVERLGFTLAHGSPRDPVWEYVLSEDTARTNMSAFGTNYCLVGHTHVPAAYAFEAQRVLAQDLQQGSTVPLDGRRLILNPGAVGQPRDHDPRASYAIIDTDAKQYSLWRVPYDIEAVQMRMKSAALPSRLIERLSYGV